MEKLTRAEWISKLYKHTFLAGKISKESNVIYYVDPDGIFRGYDKRTDSSWASNPNDVGHFGTDFHTIDKAQIII